MEESRSTTPRRFEYVVVTKYSIFADTDEQADSFLSHAMEGSVFNDNVNISKFTINKTEHLDNNGTKEYLWNQEKQSWTPTRFSL